MIRLTVYGRVPFGYELIEKVDGVHAFVGNGFEIFLYEATVIDHLGFVRLFRTVDWSRDVTVHEDTNFLPTGLLGVHRLDLMTEVEG